MKVAVAVALVLGAMTVPSLCHAESLGDAAKREAERRKKVEDEGTKAPSFGDKDYTEGNYREARKASDAKAAESKPAPTGPSPEIRDDPASPPPVEGARRDPAAGGTAASGNRYNGWRDHVSGSSGAQPDPSPTPSSAGNGEEQAWRQRAASARQELAAAQSAYDAVMKEQLRYPKMTTWHDQDGNLQAGVDGVEMMANMRDLKARQDAAKQRLDNARAAIDNLEDDARRAGALPGWLR